MIWIVFIPILAVANFSLVHIIKQKYEKTSEYRIDHVHDLLPGVPCNACGLENCWNFAKAVVEDNVSISKCTPLTEESFTQLKSFTEQTSETLPEKLIAAVMCLGDKSKATFNFNYVGKKTCKSAKEAGGGGKACQWACIGFGDCIEVCKFDAMAYQDNGLPYIFNDKCTGCRECEEVCPVDVIDMVPITSKRIIYCKNLDPEDISKTKCDISCTGCKICIEYCPYDAITMIHKNLATIHYDLCTNCGLCEEPCPTNVIALHN